MPAQFNDDDGNPVITKLHTNKKNIIIHRIWDESAGNAMLHCSPIGNVCDGASGENIYGAPNSRPDNTAIGGTFNPTFATYDPKMDMQSAGSPWNSVRLGCGHGVPDGNADDVGWDATSGEAGNANSEGYIGKIYEFMVFRGALTELGVTQLEAYLKKKHEGSEATNGGHEYNAYGQ